MYFVSIDLSGEGHLPRHGDPGRSGGMNLLARSRSFRLPCTYSCPPAPPGTCAVREEQLMNPRLLARGLAAPVLLGSLLLLPTTGFSGGPAVPAAGSKDPEHWAFQPMRRPVLPAVRDRSWVRSPVDAFVLARL